MLGSGYEPAQSAATGCRLLHAVGKPSSAPAGDAVQSTPEGFRVHPGGRKVHPQVPWTRLPDSVVGVMRLSGAVFQGEGFQRRNPRAVLSKDLEEVGAPQAHLVPGCSWWGFTRSIALVTTAEIDSCPCGSKVPRGSQADGKVGETWSLQAGPEVPGEREVGCPRGLHWLSAGQVEALQNTL